MENISLNIQLKINWGIDFWKDWNLYKSPICFETKTIFSNQNIVIWKWAMCLKKKSATLMCILHSVKYRYVYRWEFKCVVLVYHYINKHFAEYPICTFSFTWNNQLSQATSGSEATSLNLQIQLNPWWALHSSKRRSSENLSNRRCHKSVHKIS